LKFKPDFPHCLAEAMDGLEYNVSWTHSVSIVHVKLGETPNSLQVSI